MIGVEKHGVENQPTQKLNECQCPICKRSRKERVMNDKWVIKFVELWKMSKAFQGEEIVLNEALAKTIFKNNALAFLGFTCEDIAEVMEYAKDFNELVETPSQAFYRYFDETLEILRQQALSNAQTKESEQ